MYFSRNDKYLQGQDRALYFLHLSPPQYSAEDSEDLLREGTQTCVE